MRAHSARFLYSSRSVSAIPPSALLLRGALEPWLKTTGHTVSSADHFHILTQVHFRILATSVCRFQRHCKRGGRCRAPQMGSAQQSEAKAHVLTKPLNVVGSPAVVEQAKMEALRQVRLFSRKIYW
jgi:hypothetical protein